MRPAALTNVADVTQDHAEPRAMRRTIASSVSPGAVRHVATADDTGTVFLSYALRPRADYFANIVVERDAPQAGFAHSLRASYLKR